MAKAAKTAVAPKKRGGIEGSDSIESRRPNRLTMLGIAAVVGIGAAQAEELPLNLSVTQATIGETVCVSGWTKTIRPPFSVTNRIKSELLRNVGLTDADKSRFELDHIIPLSLGGAPSDVRNLQLQPWTEATEKDGVEACLARVVCEGRLTLDEARRAIWNDWRDAERFCGS